MPFVYYGKEEWYPVYEISPPVAVRDDRCIELSDEELAFFLKVEEDFEKAQQMLHDKVVNSGANR